MALDTNLKKLGIMLQAMEEDHLSRADFTNAFKRLVDAINKTRMEMEANAKQINQDRVDTVNKTVDKALATLATAEESFSKKLEKAESNMQSDSRTVMRLVNQKMSEIKGSIPEAYDDSEVLKLINEIIDSIPEMPKEFDASDIVEAIQKLQKEVKELRKRPTTTNVTGGGVTNARIQQAFKYILKTEEPSGTIDGANKDFTLSQPIFAVLAMSLNGETIAQLPNYTISGKTISFSSAIPAAYNGKDWEVKYI